MLEPARCDPSALSRPLRGTSSIHAVAPASHPSRAHGGRSTGRTPDSCSSSARTKVCRCSSITSGRPASDGRSIHAPRGGSCQSPVERLEHVDDLQEPPVTIEVAGDVAQNRNRSTEKLLELSSCRTEVFVREARDLDARQGPAVIGVDEKGVALPHDQPVDPRMPALVAHVSNESRSSTVSRRRISRTVLSWTSTAAGRSAAL